MKPMSEFNLEELPDLIKLLEHERDYFDYPSPTCEKAINAINDLRAKVEELENFVEIVEGAIGCTDGDDIRTHIEPELAALKEEVKGES